MGLQPGAQAPDFELTDQEGNTFRLSEAFGNNPLVLFFYPRDFTPGCTAEACSFRDRYEDFTESGALVVGISADSDASHRRFARKFSLPYKLLSDPERKVSRLYGVEGRLLNLLPGRETFVIDPSGTIVLNYRSLGASGHVREALDTIRKLY